MVVAALGRAFTADSRQTEKPQLEQVTHVELDGDETQELLQQYTVSNRQQTHKEQNR